MESVSNSQPDLQPQATGNVHMVTRGNNLGHVGLAKHHERQYRRYDIVYIKDSL